MAQTPGTGALTGTVKDPSGAVIPNATVTATSVDTGQTRTTMTGGDGVYHFSLLPPGNYRIRIESSGFKPVEVPSVTIAVTETEVLDRNLDVGAQSQTVTVEGEVENIQTASSALGTVVNTRSMEALPLSTRNFTNLLAMTAGANAGVANSTTLGKSATGIAVNGADIGQNTYLQDGVAVNTWSSTNTTQEGTNSGAFPTPNPDTIQEFKIQVSNYDAGYGRNPGANVNVITKSGTNAFHGSGFEFFRNTSLNSNDYFRNAAGGSKLELNQSQFGGTFGGPVKKDKLFFFVAYQETAEKNGIAGFGYSVVNLSPIPNMPRGNCPLSATQESQCDLPAQAFAQSLGTIVSQGATATPNIKQDKTTTGTVKVDPSGTNINPIALRLMQLQLPNGQYVMPGAYTANGGCSAVTSACQYPLSSFTDPATFHDHQGMGNWDYILSNKHTLSGRYFFEQDPTDGNFASNGTRITATNILPGFPVHSQKTYHAALLRLTSVLSNNLVNEARVSYQRVFAQANNLNTYTNSQMGITDLTPGVDNLSQVSISGLYSFGSNTAFGLSNKSNQFEFADQVSWTLGKHTFRTGAEGQHVINDASSTGSTYMNVGFKSFADFLIGLPACVAGATGPVTVVPHTSNTGTLGIPGPAVPCNGSTSASSVNSAGGTTQANANYQYMFRLNYINAFVQDDIKLTPRFTVNAGVRWEWDGFPTLANGVSSTYWPSLALASPVPGTGCVLNGVQAGAGSTGTGCSLAGFVVPNNYTGNLPAGVTRNTTPYISQTTPPWHNFAPRLGFAWRPLSSNRFVVRGGAGIFYELINGIQGAYMPMRVMPGAVNVQKSPLASWTVPGVAPASVPGPVGGFGFTPLWGNPATNQTSNIQQNLVPQNLTTPLTYEWNLNTQYEFLPNWVLELGYVGSHGIRQEQGGSVINASYWNPAQLITPGSPLAVANGINCDNLTPATACNTAANANLRTPFLGMSTNSNLFATNGAYVFNALLATVRKQFSKGLQLQLSYTWSKGLITQGYGINTAPYSVLQLGANPDYHPQRVVINYVWNLPVHMNGIGGKILNDWTWAGVTTIQNGVAFSVYDSNSGRAFFQGGVGSNTYGPALICPGVNPLTSGPIETRLGGSLSANGYLNPAAFADSGGTCSLPIAPGDDPTKNTATMFGNIGLGTYLSPGQYNWDMSIAKLIKIRESKSLEFRGEFFNTFNHPQFSFNPVDDPAFAAQDVGGPNPGQVTVSSVNPRLIQFVLKFLF